MKECEYRTFEDTNCRGVLFGEGFEEFDKAKFVLVVYLLGEFWVRWSTELQVGAIDFLASHDDPEKIKESLVLRIVLSKANAICWLVVEWMSEVGGVVADWILTVARGVNQSTWCALPQILISLGQAHISTPMTERPSTIRWVSFLENREIYYPAA